MAKDGKNDLYEDLKRWILTMELEPDSDLDETTLSERYGLSRTPVRDILRRLAGEGYIVIRENRGARVAPMNHSTLRNFFLVAPMVYAAVGRLASQNAKPQQLVELKEAQSHFRAASIAHDVNGMALTNNRFHEIMGEMSGNVYLQPSLSRLLIDHARIGHTFFHPRDEEMRRRLDLAVEHHDNFIEALEVRDEERIVSLVFEHWQLSKENMSLFIVPKTLDVDFTMER